MKIIKIITTRCQILRVKCIKFNFGWGFAPDPAGGAYGAPNPLAGLRKVTSKGEGKKKGRRGKGKGKVTSSRLDIIIKSNLDE